MDKHVWKDIPEPFVFAPFFVVEENEEQTGKLKKELKEEKYLRKRLESKVDHVEEELTDLRHEKESLDKVSS